MNNEIDWVKASEALDVFAEHMNDYVIGVAKALQEILLPIMGDYIAPNGQIDNHAADRKRSRDDMNAKRKDLFKRRGKV